MLGVSSEETHELAGVRTELGSAAREISVDPFWVSMIGEPEALRERSDKAREHLERQGIEVIYHEMADRRSTYVVAAGDGTHAVETLYLGVLEP